MSLQSSSLPVELSNTVKIGSPSERPYLVPIDTAYFDIFVLFLRRRVFAQIRRLPCAAGRGKFERNQTPYNCPVYASPAFAGELTRVHLRAREDTWRIFLGEHALTASSAPTPMQLFCGENRRVVVATILELPLSCLRIPGMMSFSCSVATLYIVQVATLSDAVEV